MAASPETPHPEPHPEQSKNVALALWKHLQDNLLQYLGGAAFIVAVLVFTGLYRLTTETKDRELSSAYAKAILLEDAAERAEALATLAAGNTRLTPHALYMRGEALLSTRDYPAATEAFSTLRETYPDFKFVPDAVEGLGFVQEDQGNTEAALAVYREVRDKWPDTPAGRRQAFNIARCYENSGDFEQAIQFYREQFETFPGSSVALQAQQRLLTLRATQPDLFEDELADTPAQTADEQSEEPPDQEASEIEILPEEKTEDTTENSSLDTLPEDETEDTEPAETETQEVDPAQGDESTPDQG